MLKNFQIFFQNQFDFFENAVMFHLLTKEISSVLRIAGWYFQAVEIRSLPEISGRRYPVRKYNLIWSVPEMIEKSVNIAGFEIWED